MQKGPARAALVACLALALTYPPGETTENRPDIRLVFNDLPEPIDIKIDRRTQTMCWTDREEYPMGCALYRASVGGESIDMQK